MPDGAGRARHLTVYQRDSRPDHRTAARTPAQRAERGDRAIDRRLAHGHISKDDAAAAHREVDDIQSDLADVRLRNGGQVPSDEHFRLQDRVNKLKEKIDSERIGAPSH
jgi:hypothetical protein